MVINKVLGYARHGALSSFVRGLAEVINDAIAKERGTQTVNILSNKLRECIMAAIPVKTLGE